MTRSSPVSRRVKLSQKNILNLHKHLKNIPADYVNKSHLSNLKEKLKHERQKHRKLLRSENASDSCKRDAKLFSILENNTSDIFKLLRRQKQNNSGKISKLSANGKVYSGHNVGDGFYDSLLELKTFNPQSIQDPPTYSRHLDDYHNIIELSRTGAKLPSISIQISREILEKIRPEVHDYYSITAYHFLYAGTPGIAHFHLLLSNLISDINSISLEEVNSVHATILFKGHSKDRGCARSYRTISTCPLTAKALDIYVRDLNIDVWDSCKASTQFLGPGSSHELASLTLTEVIQHSHHVLNQPVFILYLDAKSAFDKVIRELLIRNLYSCGTQGEELLLIDARLKHRKTFLEWDKVVMGPICDQVGVEQGGVSSGD